MKKVFWNLREIKMGRFRIGRKGQAQMMETIGVIFIFFVLILFGAIFYFKFSVASFEAAQEEAVAQQAMDNTLLALFMPEIICSRGEAEAEDNCVDLTKVRVLETVMQEHTNDYYFNIFGFSTISVTMVYPGERTWVIYDREKVETLEDGTVVSAWERKEPTFFVISTKDETSGRAEGEYEQDGVYGFGYLTVEVYS